VLIRRHLDLRFACELKRPRNATCGRRGAQNTRFERTVSVRINPSGLSPPLKRNTFYVSLRQADGRFLRDSALEGNAHRIDGVPFGTAGQVPLALHVPPGANSPVAAARQAPISSRHRRGLELAGCYRSEGAHSEA